MSPFKKCILSSQQILYKSLYLNPLSDSPEHPLTVSTSLTASTELTTSSSSSSTSSYSAKTAVARASELKETNGDFESRPSSAKRDVGVSNPGKLRMSDLEIEPRHRQYAGSTASSFDETEPLFLPPTPTHYLAHFWNDQPDSDVAPASAWSTLGNRTLLHRPLPVDVGRCVCYIVRERSRDGMSGYALYTDEGHGRRDRKLAVAYHKRPSGRSEFVVFPVASESGVKAVDGPLGRVQANLLGSRYSIWDEVDLNASRKRTISRPLLGVVMFEPTITTLSGTYRVMRACIPKYQSMQIIASNQRERNGLPNDWEKNTSNVHQLFSRKPLYNKVTRRHELDFRERAKKSARIKTSTKNLQLTMNENGRQSILMLGKIGKSKYLMEYRFPLTAYQAFSICLASMDSKLCCSI